MADILFKTDDFIFSYRVGGLLSAVLIFAFVNTLIKSIYILKPMINSAKSKLELTKSEKTRLYRGIAACSYGVILLMFKRRKGEIWNSFFY